MAHLRLYTDGASRGNPGEAAVGLVLKDEQGKVLAARHRYLGHATNNVAEYVALARGLRLAAEFAPGELDVYLDSKLVVEQANGRWRVKDENLRVLHSDVLHEMAAFAKIRISHIPRERNAEADALANQALDEEDARRRRA